MTKRFCPILVLLLLSMAAGLDAADDLASREQQAFQAAVDRVGPSVVRIETIGGRERLGKLLLGTGPTTGLIVDRDGLIISSTFNFLRRPDSILVKLPDGTRKPAKLVATDHVRMLTLLKIEPDSPLPVPEMAPHDQTRVGQWAIAVGRTFEGKNPNTSVGIVSALSRIRGCALQTDAAASPANYGGPLLDVRGRVLGVLTPLSPTPNEKTGRIEWYDSGIGFAVPADDVMRAVARLRKGEDLYPGRIGISFEKAGSLTAEPILAGCHSRSPAYGILQTGDRITAIDGKPVARMAELIDAVGRYYAGDQVTLQYQRDGQHRETILKLLAELPPYERPFLGILPRRDTSKTNGHVTIRYVYPDSAASKAGIQPGDKLLALAGNPLADADMLRQRIALLGPNIEITLDISHDGNKRSISVQLGHMPESMPDEALPPARDKSSSTNENSTQHGKKTIHVPDVDNKAWVYVPKSQSASSPSGLVVWLDAPGEIDDAGILRRWKTACEKYNLILLTVNSTQPRAWVPDEEAVVAQLIAEVTNQYAVDENRIVLHGYKGGGGLARLVTMRHRDLVRGLSLVETTLPAQLPEVDPMRPLAIHLAVSNKLASGKQMDQSTEVLRKAHHPVESQKLGENPRYLSTKEIERLAKWIDTLDRI